MRKLFALALLSASTLLAAPPVRPPVVEYRIDADFDAKAHTIKGREHLVWRNPSNDTVGELQFHLYLNAFRNSESTFMRESGGRLRRDRFADTAREWGKIDVTSMKITGGADLTKQIRFIQPDDGNRDDQTVIAVSLPSPVPPRGTIELDIAFDAKLPSIFARTGFVRDFHLVGQWFPKIGVYEPAGRRHRKSGGWNTHQFHAHSEFYADFGDYDVVLRVPENYVVGATGKLLSKTKERGKAVHRYQARDVHDFAWTADPRYVVHEIRFEPERDVPVEWIEETSNLLAIAPAALRLRPVQIRILMQPDHDEQWTRYAEATKKALAWCGLRYGVYPYDTLTVVDPPEDGMGAGGMEYPTFFTGATRRSYGAWPLDEFRIPELVVLHEFVHGYWQGMVASNEFEESWLDEGITSLTEQQAMDRLFEWEPYKFPLLPGVSVLATNRASFLRYERHDPIVRPSWGYASSSSYAVNSYSIPALVLAQMEKDLGEATFAKAIRAYFQEWSFRHPDTLDFFETFSRVSGRDLSHYRERLFFRAHRGDLKVLAATSGAEIAPSGWFGAKLLKSSNGTDEKRRAWRSEVVIVRDGQLPLAADVVYTFADGKVVRKRFHANYARLKSEFRYAHKLVSVEIDPENRNLLDSDLFNNSRRLGEPKPVSAKATVRFAGVFARLLDLVTALV